MGYYPILVEMTGRPCVVIGGGAVAERKVEALLEVGARVTVISPALTERLRSFAGQEKIRHLARAYQSGDLTGYALAFVATDKATVNEEALREASGRGILINAVDDPDRCDFILPSVLRRGDLVVAVSTGAASPALARSIREELEGYFTADYKELAQIVGETRREVKEKRLAVKPEAWHRALNGALRRLVKEGNREQAKAYLLRRLGVEA